MIRKLLATTALATLIAGGAYAQSTTAPAPAAPAAPAEVQQPADQAAPAMRADGYLASNLIGENVYNGTGDKAEKIGDVNDLVIDHDGNVQAVVVGVGGFLGMGEKNVALEFDAISWAERDGDRWIVVDSSKDALKQLPEFDRSAYDAAPVVATDNTATAPANDTTAMAPAGDTNNSTAMNKSTETEARPSNETAQAPAAGTDTTAQVPAASDPAASTDHTKTGAIDRSSLNPLDTAAIRSEDLVGTTVYGANEENVGEIGDIVLTQDGKVDAVIIDVGGFLGMGEKEVAVGMDNLAFLTDEDGNKYLYTNFTKEQLEAAAAYDKSTWADKRDEQRMILKQ